MFQRRSLMSPSARRFRQAEAVSAALLIKSHPRGGIDQARRSNDHLFFPSEVQLRFLHLLLIFSPVCAAVCKCACVRVCVPVCVVLRFLKRGGDIICILEATLHTSNCIIHLFITLPPLYMFFPRRSKQRSHKMCNPFVIGDQFLHL